MNVPRISVIVPTLDRARFLPECIGSVFATGYPKLEVLVVDDGSTDDTQAVLTALQSVYGARLRCLRHADGQRCGVSASRNLGLAHATSDLVCFLDSDDLMLPHRFDGAARALANDSSLDGVFEFVELEHEDGSLTLPHYYPRTLSANASAPVLIGSLGVLASCGLLLRREIVVRCGMFDVRRTVGEDFELWLKITATGRLAPGQWGVPVARVRKHRGNTRGYSAAQVELSVVRDVYAWARAHGLSQEVCSALRTKYFSLLYYYAQHEEPTGTRLRAGALLMRAAAAFPSALATRRYWGNIVRHLT